MTKLTDTQAILLSTASQREDGSVKAAQAAPLHYTRFAPPPGWAPPRVPFDRLAIDCQPEDRDDVAGWRDGCARSTSAGSTATASSAGRTAATAKNGASSCASPSRWDYLLGSAQPWA